MPWVTLESIPLFFGPIVITQITTAVTSSLSFLQFILHTAATKIFHKDERKRDFPGGTVVKNLPANAGDTGSSPGLGRSHMPWSN